MIPVISFYFSAVCFGMIGPSENILRMPAKDKNIMICGLFFIGLFSSLGVIPTIPEAVDLVA